jgi:hypothetical protein
LRIWKTRELDCVANDETLIPRVDERSFDGLDGSELEVSVKAIFRDAFIRQATSWNGALSQTDRKLKEFSVQFVVKLERPTAKNRSSGDGQVIDPLSFRGLELNHHTGLAVNEVRRKLVLGSALGVFND